MFELDASPWNLPVAGFIVTEVSFFGLPKVLFAGQPARGDFIIAYNDKSGWTFRDYPEARAEHEAPPRDAVRT